MGILQVSNPGILSPITQLSNSKSISPLHFRNQFRLHARSARLNATTAENATSAPEAAITNEPPSIDFAFVGVSFVNLISCKQIVVPAVAFMLLLLLQSRLLPDGTPDVAIRSAVGGQKLRDVMLDCNIDLYGPYVTIMFFLHFFHLFLSESRSAALIQLKLQDQPLSNCAGGGTCGTCLVEVKSN